MKELWQGWMEAGTEGAGRGYLPKLSDTKSKIRRRVGGKGKASWGGGERANRRNKVSKKEAG